MLQYNVGITNVLDRIFGGIFYDKRTIDPSKASDIEIIKTTSINFQRFVSNFPSNIFQDEYAIFYEISKSAGVKLFDVGNIRTIIENSRELVLDSPYIDIQSMTNIKSNSITTADEKIESVIEELTDKFNILSKLVVSPEEFNSSCLIYISYFKNQYMLETAQNMTIIMNNDDGLLEKKPGKRVEKYYGFDDAKRYYNERMRILNEISDSKNRVRTTVLDSEWYVAEQQNDKKLDDKKYTDDKALITIGIKGVDDTLGYLRRSNMLGILGPPKGGKTRFTNYLVQRALAAGYNVCVWPLEGTKEEWIAMQTASFIARKEGLFLDSKKILQRNFDSNNERQLVQTARYTMVAGNGYGTLSFIESTAYVEDFIQVLDSHYENDNPFDVIVIDSLVNILSRTGRNKVDRISSAYMELKSYISNTMKRQALAIIPAQLKQEAVNYLRAHPGETLDVTSGGESAETIRSPDEIIGLFSSKEERAGNRIKLYSVGSRHSDSFDDLWVEARLGSCFFRDFANQ